MIYRICAVALLSISVMIGATVADVDKGAEQMSLDGGSRGNVPFPHRTHQNVLLDCNLCHALFPQQAGSIERLKADGKLSGKQVMNKQCIKCHKAEKRAGNKTGPTTCGACHVRK